LRERQILSDLHHPGIAQLIDGAITTATEAYELGKLFLTLAESLELDGERQRVLEVATAEDPEHR